jgi:hypothetical protein
MVWENNITSVPQMKTLLEVFMKEALFSGHHIPAITNKRFWPSNIDIQNHIALAIKKQRNNNIDQVMWNTCNIVFPNHLPDMVFQSLVYGMEQTCRLKNTKCIKST